jgi:hypothetical protein
MITSTIEKNIESAVEIKYPYLAEFKNSGNVYLVISETTGMLVKLGPNSERKVGFIHNGLNYYNMVRLNQGDKVILTQE